MHPCQCPETCEGRSLQNDIQSYGAPWGRDSALHVQQQGGRQVPLCSWRGVHHPNNSPRTAHCQASSSQTLQSCTSGTGEPNATPKSALEQEGSWRLPASPSMPWAWAKGAGTPVRTA